MKFNKSKSTKRFSFDINRNTTSHKAGANQVTITSRGDVEYFGRSQGSESATVTMTVKEAKAFNRFLNDYLDGSPSTRS